MTDLILEDAVVAGELDEYKWLDIKLDAPRDGGFCISEDEATMLIMHLATVFEIDLSKLEND